MKTLKFLWSYAIKYKGSLLLTVFSMMMLVIVQLFAPWIVREMIGLVTDGVSEEAFARVGQLALLGLGVFAARAVFTFIRSYAAHVAGWGVVADVRSGLYSHLQRLSLRFYENRQTGRAHGELTFENVSFHYVPGVPVLADVTLTVPAGASAALVGPTGVGKTTMAALISRFYDPVDGRILLDGIDTRMLKLPALRSQIGMVLQDVFLFHGTIKENVLFARPDATDEQVVDACRAANAEEFIVKLTEGYDTVIGERGVKLSGGQKQRIAIARALLADKPILILDEATSAVDTETEKLIQQALEHVMEGRTTIIVAHRLSTIRKADIIVVLDEGGIAESGTHDDLVSLGGIYHKLHEVYA
ncbi:MAG: ATP-binding cassette domain-containing protein [Spirochaetaceae bacterium]|nr:MAG: ATP-binding cassette domain-containing protein [Spirochaetaceae bacterium]